MDLRKNMIRRATFSGNDLTQLEYLNLSDNPINEFSPGFFTQASLQELILTGTLITQLPDTLTRLKNLRVLALPQTLKTIPKTLGDITTLRSLSCMYNPNIKSFPETVLNNARLEYLLLDGTKINKLPSNLSDKLKRLKQLSLSNCGLTEIPENLFELQRLKQIDLSNNRISVIPKLGSLPQLEFVNLENVTIEAASLMNLKTAVPFARIRYFSQELGMNFESKPVENNEEATFQAQAKKCAGGNVNACFELGQSFEKNGDYGFAFSLYNKIALQLTDEGSAQHALTYYKIAELYDDTHNKKAYNSIYKRKVYNDYDDYNSNLKYNRSLSLYCKLCEETPKDAEALVWIKKGCAKASLIYNETADNLKNIYEENRKEIIRLLGSAGDMANVAASGNYLMNTSTSNAQTIVGGLASIFGSVSKSVKEDKSEKKKRDNERLKDEMQTLLQKADYYLTLK